MATIKDLSFNDTPQSSDSVPIYGTSSGTTQRTSVNKLLQGGLSSLPTVQPVDGSGELWIDVLDGNAIKAAVGPSSTGGQNLPQTVINIANGTSTDAGTLTGAEITPVSRGNGATQTTIANIAAFALKAAQITSVKSFGAKGDGLTIDDVAIQAALNNAAITGGVVYVPPGLYLIDNQIAVPANVRLIGSGNASVIKVVGNDTHGRNSALFYRFNNRQWNGVATIAFPSAIKITGSYASVENLKLDTNGHNNYAPNSGYAGSPNDWLQEPLGLGICGVLIGDDMYRASAAVAPRIIYRSFVRHVEVWNSSWGGISINGQVMNMTTTGSAAADDLYGCAECGVISCHLEQNNSNTIQLNGVTNARVIGNTVISPYHAGIKTYTRVRGALIEGNTIICDDARQVIWHPQQVTVAGYRETELATRSEMICVGHSDYDTEIRDVTVIGNKVNGNSVGVMHGIMVYGRCKNVVVENNHVYDTIFGVSFTFPESVTIRGNSLRSVPYTTSGGSVYGGADIGLWPRSTEVNKTLTSQYCNIVIANNTLHGQGVSNFRISSFSRYTDQNLYPVIRFEDNDCKLDSLAAYGGVSLAPVGVFSTAGGGGVYLTDNRYYQNGSRAGYAAIYSVNSFAKIFDPLEGTFSPVATGNTTAGVGTYTKQSGFYRMRDGIVTFSIDMAWTAHTGVGNLSVDGLPFALTSDSLASAFPVTASGLTFAGQLVAQAGAGQTAISLLSMTTGAGVANIAMDTSVNALRITGTYKAF